MGADLGAAATTDAAVAHQDPVNGGDGWHRLAGMGLGQELVEFAGAPTPSSPELEDLADHGGRGRVGIAPFAAADLTIGKVTLSAGARYDYVRLPFENLLDPTGDTTATAAEGADPPYSLRVSGTPARGGP